MLHPKSQCIASCQAEVCYITLHTLYLFVRNIDIQFCICFYEQILLLYIVRCHWSNESNLLLEINCCIIWIHNMTYSLVSLRCFQRSQIYFQYSHTIEYIFLTHLQDRGCTWIKELYRRRQNLFLCL